MYDVIIAGSGTVGLTIANLLANLGLKICLIEKRNRLNEISNAVGVNDECLFAWQACGVLEKISEYIAFNQPKKTILKYLDENGHEFFSLRQTIGIAGFVKGVVFLQNKIDEVLLNELKQKSEVIFDEELLTFTQDQKQVCVKTKNKTYFAKYLIAADGKESAVRKILGIKFKVFSKSKDEWLILNLLVKNRILEKEFVEVFCGKRSVVSCPLPLDFHRIEISLKAEEKNLCEDEKNIKKLLENYINFSDYKIINKFKYRFVTGIAEKYFQNRVVLCGDAAHCTSPFASAGLVSGIRDCLALYEIFKSKKIDFSLYQKSRYRKQIRSLKLAMLLEKIMRPNRFFQNFIFTSLKFFGKSSTIIKFLSIRS
jgi:3-(3-hydroxy-phenyl)propionate hydroxylase